MPTVSVVLPAFNAERTIARAIRSILQQTFDDFELIVIDDGSTDQTASVVKSFADDRLRLVQQPHTGVATAANHGTQLSSAPLIARMDADDVSDQARLERQIRYLNDHDLDVVGCFVQIEQQHKPSSAGLLRYQRWINEETATAERIAAFRFVEFPIVNPTILAQRAYFEPGFRNNHLPEDYDLFLRAFSCGLKIGKVPETLFTWHDSDGRLTRTDDRYTTTAFVNCRREHLLTGPLAGVDEVRFWGAGQSGKPWLRWLANQQIKVRCAVDVNDRKIGQRIHRIPIVGPEDLPPADGIPLLIAVGSDGARRLIEHHIQERHYRPGSDAWFLA